MNPSKMSGKSLLVFPLKLFDTKVFSINKGNDKPWNPKT